jgi:3-dehydroquinate synthase
VPQLVEERHPHARPVVIADATVAELLPSPLAAAPVFTFPAGERHKTRATWSTLTDQLMAAHFGRDTVIVAFGGGVTTDLAGFVAATFLRGVPWIAVPTTTLAMLDAAVGGKTGVDTAAGKNLVGAVHPPSAVLCDPATLTTLPARIFREGLAEAVKHAVALDPRYADWIAAHSDLIADRDPVTLESLVRRSVELKAEVVMDDESEQGRRAVLNAGHTIAHALERVTDYAVPHGEAVAIGLVLETRVAEAMRVATPGTADRIAQLFTRLGLPVDLPGNITAASLIAAMGSDKKNRAGTVRAALLASFGEVADAGADIWTFPLDLEALEALMAH